MEANEANALILGAAASPAYGRAIAIFLVLLGLGVAYALAPFAVEKPAVVAAVSVFPILLIALFGLPSLQCLPLGPRVLLILLTLRPLVDVSQAFQTVSAGVSLVPSSKLSLQDTFAATFGLLLVIVWFVERHATWYRRVPTIFLLALLGLTSFSWAIGGFGDGARGFARTAWGLLVALLLGTVFRTERQIDIFVRTIFYSSVFVLMTLSLNLDQALSHDFWRLGGQYGTPNALAGVALSFFLYGLYTFGRARKAPDKLFSLLLLLLLSVVIVSTQSRTVGALMLMSICLFLWATRRRWLLFGLTIPVLFFLFMSTAGTAWRLTSTFSLTNKEVDPTVLTLQGRIFLWGEWLKQYMDASLFHKVFGLGWGVVLRDFLAMAFPTSSVTESSFLWFLVGTGALGLLAFCIYLLWILLKSFNTWRKASNDFERQFALLVFLAAICFVVEGVTTDVASAPNAAVYIFGIMSIFVFQQCRKTTAGEPSKL